MLKTGLPRLPLHIRFSLMIGAAFLLMNTLMIYLAHSSLESYLIKETGEKLEVLARTAALQLDSELHASIRGRDDANGAEFQALQKTLRAVKAANNWPEAIYTFRPQGDVLKFVLMTQDKTFVGETYDPGKFGIRPYIDYVLKEKKSTYTPIYQSTNQRWITAYAPILNQRGEVEAILNIDMSADSFFELLRRELTPMLWLAGFITLAIFGFTFVFMLSLLKPLRQTISHIKDVISTQDLTLRLEINQKNEIGELADWFNVFTDNLKALLETLRGTIENLTRESGGILAESEKQATQASQLAARNSEVLDKGQQISGSLNDIEHSVSEATNDFFEIAETTTAIHQRIESFGKAFKNIDKGVHEVGAALSTLTGAINQVAENTHEASQVFEQASLCAQQTQTTSSQLEMGVGEIGKVIGMIKTIADKTNLLALNAGIEAAGAGEAGRGFGVVANEVKELAKQTQKATEEINQKMERIFSQTHETATASANISQFVTSLSEKSQVINTAVVRQSEMVDEVNAFLQTVQDSSLGLSQQIGRIGDETRDISRMLQHAVEETQQINQASQSVGKTAAELHGFMTEAAEMSSQNLQSLLNNRKMQTWIEQLNQLDQTMVATYRLQ